VSDQRNGGISWTEALKERFWSYVDMRGPDDCWEWRAAICEAVASCEQRRAA
jgi:hypothetical protein